MLWLLTFLLTKKIIATIPIRTLPVNMVGRLNLSDSSVEVWRGSEASLNSTQTWISTFNSELDEAFIVANQKEDKSDDYYEEADSLRVMPKLTPAPVLADITNTGRREFPSPNKAEKLDDLNEPSAADIKESYGIKLDDKELYCMPTKIQRLRKQPVRVLREIPHCTGKPISKARGALSRSVQLLLRRNTQTHNRTSAREMWLLEKSKHLSLS